MIELPIFIWDPSDLMFFTSITYAESYIEAIDVLNDEYTACDRQGRLLKLSVILYDRVKILEYEPETICTDLLREQIVSYLSHLATVHPKRFPISREWLHQATLDELVEKMLAIVPPTR